ncbi:DOPA 4,5-dioxygenase family protein [Janthinobacterium agaricidamnosum]|uniref:Dopa 4,5-dioxygenase family protein n=1 Tax=Janthinobacterium agaricidamnosum NBRC 102515 = DSM 9628 TaxID=1349767 RepID=W0V835_9BURK|nr:DOPA 4,5-dioxygenase family protein [Janthinobacterium agaricidamnosum]CDG84969.1 dopa 4,5-dioxygenase family protein [Janthinobacterium agaricidamnosum NBRC 102515 = DSM 9628]
MTERFTLTSDAEDQEWANLLSPQRRSVLGGFAATALVAGGTLAGSALAQGAPAASGTVAASAAPVGKSPWGYETDKAPTPRPPNVRPGENPLPATPRAYTDIESYHAHIYFDEDNYQKAALIRQWVAERFKVELGDWNVQPRGPHVTPSFYFGFTNDLLPVIVPWLQLNSLGLTILIHPNTEDPRADHLYYALWVNRSQPVNAYGMKNPGPGEPRVEQIFVNTRPTVKLET